MRFLFGLPGAAVPLLLLLAGTVFTARLRGFCFLHPIRTLRAMLSGQSRRRSFSALTMALAGTLGVGNITGVALAIAVGGPGTVFWMWVSAAAAMTVRYAEVVLALDLRQGERVGAMYYLPGRIAPGLFAAFCAAAAFFLGGALQSAAAAECAEKVLGIPPLPVGLLFLLLTAAVIFGGAKRIAKTTVFLIPFVTLLYLALAGGVMVTYAGRIPAVFREIVSDAFQHGGAVGGIAGFLVSERVRIGFARGLLSNEAGCGTAPLAHASAVGVHPAQQGLWGIFEVFVDTILLCTVTALVILLPGNGIGGGGISAVLSPLRTVFGEGAAIALTLAISLFAYATVLSWSHYGVSAAAFLFPGKRAKTIYLVCLCLALPAGALLPTGFLYGATDFLLAVMTLLQVVALLKNADRICVLSARYFMECGISRPRRVRRRESAPEDARPTPKADPACPAPRARR